MLLLLLKVLMRHAPVGPKVVAVVGYSHKDAVFQGAAHHNFNGFRGIVRMIVHRRQHHTVLLVQLLELAKVANDADRRRTVVRGKDLLQKEIAGQILSAKVVLDLLLHAVQERVQLMWLLWSFFVVVVVVIILLMFVLHVLLLQHDWYC